MAKFAKNLKASKLYSLASLLACLSALPLLAMETTQSMSSQQASKAWDLETSLQMSRSVAHQDEADFAADLKGKIAASYSLRKDLSLDWDAVGVKQLNRDQLWIMVESSLGLSKVERLNDSVKLNGSLSFGFPVNKNEIRYDNSQGSLSGSVGAEIALDRYNRVKFSPGLALTRQFYQYEDNDGGHVLTKWIWVQSYALSYSHPSRLSLSLAYRNVSSQDFNNNARDDSFLLYERLSYALAEDRKTSVYLGHTNDGNTFDYLGAANNVRVYDPYTSQVFIGASQSF